MKTIITTIILFVSVFCYGQQTVVSDWNLLCIAENAISCDENMNIIENIKLTTENGMTFKYNPSTKTIKTNTVYTDDCLSGHWYSDKQESVYKNSKIKYYYKNGYYYYKIYINDILIYIIKTNNKLENRTNLVKTIYFIQ
jgi:hypothetical protein